MDLQNVDLQLDDLNVNDVQLEALSNDDAKALPEMGATCGCVSCCSCCSIL